MTDERALTITTIGTKQVYPVTYMLNMVAGLNEHYGNIVGYLRAKAITPPSTTAPDVLRDNPPSACCTQRGAAHLRSVDRTQHRRDIRVLLEHAVDGVFAAGGSGCG